MKDLIALGSKQADDKNSNEIWKFFEHKFTMVSELGKFIPFFTQMTKEAL